MSIRISALAATGVALLAAGCTSGAPSEPEAQIAFDTSRQCFFTSSINGYGDAPDGPDGAERLVVSTGPRDDWLFEAIGPCHELDFAEQIALDTGPSTSVCTGHIETLLVPSTIPGNVDRCQVRLLGKVIQPAG